MMSYVILAHDAEGSSEKRPRLRPSHLEYWGRLEDSGQMILAGPLGPGKGSLFVIDVESENAARDLIANDPYTVGGVFASWEVTPFKCVLPVSRYGASN